MTILISQSGPVTTITIDRPERRNAIDDATALLLRQAFDAFDKDDNAAVAVLTGAGGAFCAGYDLKAFADAGTTYDPNEEGPMGPTRRLLSKPVVAAIEGHAVAGGLELALWCDLRVASATAVFGVFCRRWGVPLIDGGTVRLPRLIGQGRALDMILTGRAVDAEEALAIGLASRVVPEGEALAAAQALALEIAAFPALCMRIDRASTYRSFDLDLTDALREEGRSGAEAVAQGARDGAARFSAGAGRGGRTD